MLYKDDRSEDLYEVFDTLQLHLYGVQYGY